MLLSAYYSMTWKIVFDDDFASEFADLSDGVQVALAANTELLVEFGPKLGRPHADTLSGSKYANMKELRFTAGDGVWRVAFAFDPERKAVLLVAGDKSGGSTKRFYKNLIKTADQRYSRHLAKE